MSALSISHYFPFPRVRIKRQWVPPDAKEAYLEAVPDRRFRPICHLCGKPANQIHSRERRWVRDLDFGPARVWIRCQYRKIICSHCRQTPIEELDLFDPYLRVTKRLARYIFGLAKIMTVLEVSRHLGLDWKTVKAIDQQFLEDVYGQTDYQGLRLLAVDEVSIRKGHRYLTVVLDYESGRVVWVGKDRRHLEERLNKVINAVLILKDKLKHIWTYRSRTWAEKALEEWSALARAVNHPAVRKFAETLCRYRHGILNHCDYPIHTGKLEGVNNKIKVIKRRAYGFHDVRYFSLKIIQAFAN
jgi:transposase